MKFVSKLWTLQIILNFHTVKWSRWADVKKHCQRNHGKDIDHLNDDLGVLWGLTRLDEQKAKPSYADAVNEDIPRQDDIPRQEGPFCNQV